jgi:ABC-type branched-subunit amino acid transport system substrate-binding protein
MRRSFKLVWLAIAITGLALGLAACGDDDDGGGGGEETLDLTIGDSLPLTGGLSDFGPPGEKAAGIAEDEINAAIEEAGVDHTITIVSEDNGGGDDQQAAVSSVEKIVADGASCVAGAWASADTIPIAESVAIPDEVLLISPASTSDEITGLDDPDGFINRTVPPDSLQGPTLANFMDQELGGAEGTTVNVGARNDAYGTGLVDTFSTAWEGLGGTIGEEVVYDPELPNYDSEAEQLVSGEPDATVIFDFPETYNKVGPALVRAGFDPTTTFFTDGLASSDLPSTAGEEATEGMRGTAPGAPDEGEAATAFDTLYVDSEPKDIDRQTFDAQNFDAIVLCYLAAVAAGSTEGQDMAEVVRDVSGAPGDQYTWEELPDAIDALQNGDDIDYEGASGSIEMDETGDATAGVYDTLTFKGGNIETIGEVPVAPAE